MNDNQNTTPASEKSIYFDAPLSHFRMDSPKSQHQDTRIQTPVPAVSQHPTVFTNDFAIKPHTNEEHLVYVDGNWLVRNSSSGKPGSRKQSFRNEEPRPPSLSGSLMPTDGVGRRRTVSANMNGTTRRGRSSVRSYAVGDGSTFANGAGTTGPAATPDLDSHMRSRAASADASLTRKQRSKIAKGEWKAGKQLTKVIKKESKIEKEALSVAIKELAELQAIQKATVKVESKAHTDHAAALTMFQKQERAFLAARTKYETAQAELLALEEALETSRRNAKEATESMQDKMREVEFLRAQKGVDDREREVKITELTGKKPTTLSKWL